MRVIRNGMILTVIREPGDEKYRDGEWGSGESRLLYHVKLRILNGEVENQGDLPTDVIKKRMWKDGHLVDVDQLYLRTRKPCHKDKDGDKMYLAIHNTHWAIRGLDTDFNEDGECHLQVSYCTITRPEVGKHSWRR